MNAQEINRITFFFHFTRQLTIAVKFMNRAGDKLSKQLTSPSAIIRKKAQWTMKQLGLQPKKEVMSNLLTTLLDSKVFWTSAKLIGSL